MALMEAQSTVCKWLSSCQRRGQRLHPAAACAFRALKESYDWTNGCRKLAIVVNPLMIFSDHFCPEKLRERDAKGAVGCFLLLAWALLLTGRSASVWALYTALLTGIVVQYAVLQTCEMPEAEAVAERASISACGERAKEPHHQSTRCAWGGAPGAAGPGRATAPRLSAVVSALAFCSTPLAACALLMRLLCKGAWPALAPLPAAWCTLLATHALLPHDVAKPPAAHGERALVLLPCGVLFTFLALLFVA